MFDLASFHPLLVHAPLILIPVAVLFELLHLVRPMAGLRIAAILLLAGGVGGAILATETGEAAEERSEQVSPGADAITASGFVPQTVAQGNLLKTHAELGKMTRNIYGLLLLIEVGLFAATAPALARFRPAWSLPASLMRLARGAWMLVAVAGLALVVLTGHYGGTMVYDYGVGIPRHAIAPPDGTPPGTSVAPTPESDSD